ncbi:floral homeotic protein GLOBOSA-like [Mangifera indica]|uniref:floral homeotic protein GLOBOSA-like n=1 Tax=Mangifera indica TaxID=29780 RepID=UPI001CF9F889|nr:floral homeotic protein GLOBOSA-like [Mangifera indica]
MGRGKLSMELIKKEKSRMVTYQKRKKGLEKKVQEFATLCGIPTCMIIYRPKLNNRPAEMETFPKNREDFLQVIDLFREKAALSDRGMKSLNLFDFFVNRRRKLEQKIEKIRKDNLEGKFPCAWSDRLENSSDDQLNHLLVKFDAILEVARRKIAILKEEKDLMDGCNNGQPLLQENHKMEEVEIMNNSMNFMMNNRQINLPFYPPNQALHMQPFDLNPLNNSMNFMMMNQNTNYPQLVKSTYYDPMAAMLENPMPVNFFGSSLQPFLPYEQFPFLQKFSSQMQHQHASQFNPNFQFDMNQFGANSKRRRL